MFTVGKEQLASFQTAYDRQLADNVLAFVRRYAPSCLDGLSPHMQQAHALEGIRQGRRFGLQEPRCIGLFATATFVGGPGFERQPECAAVMADTDLPPDTRVDLLFTDLVDVPWAAIRARTAAQER